MLPTQDHPYPRVGVAMFVIKDGKFLMGLRQGSHSPGVWGLPGGKLDLGESWEAGAIRETQEETGLIVKNAQFLGVTNDVYLESQLHYTTIFLIGDWDGGEVKNLEPEKCLEWRWFSPNDLPEKLLLPLQNLMLQSDLNTLLNTT